MACACGNDACQPLCDCGCGKPLPARARYASKTCQMRAFRRRRHDAGLTSRGKPRTDLPLSIDQVRDIGSKRPPAIVVDDVVFTPATSKIEDD